MKRILCAAFIAALFFCKAYGQQTLVNGIVSDNINTIKDFYNQVGTSNDKLNFANILTATAQFSGITTNGITFKANLFQLSAIVTYQNCFFLPVALRGFIVDLLSCLILLAIVIITSKGHKLLVNTVVLTGVLWIGILGTIGFNLSLRLTNILSNVTTVVIDGVRPAATFFLFPLIIYIVTNRPFLFPLAVLSIFGYAIKGANVAGIMLCCCGAVVSLRLGKPACRKYGHSTIF